MDRYCLGFVFSQRADAVALIRKERPAWMKGRWNGVGGHVEDEIARVAMVRECEEETGLRVAFELWQHFADMEFPDAVVHCYAAYAEDDVRPETRTDETVQVFPVNGLPAAAIDNLRFLVPLALYSLRHRELDVATIRYGQ